ncbi:replication factor-A protein [Hypoxylon argillaceum]|nr:replication factor-A protein [Hypoxylon argillaceum]
MSVAAAQAAITQGALDAVFNDPGNADQRFPVPILQCLQIKPLAAQQAPGAPAQQERYRVVLSDIRNYVQCMLATQANHVIHDNQLVRGCIVRVKSYQANAVKGKNILIILDLDVASDLGVHDRIGEPAPFEAKAQAANTTTAIGGSGFYGAKAESSAPVKSEPMSSRMGPGGGGGGGSNTHGNIVIYPIESLSPYAHKWTIKARVSSKSDIKTWHKASGEGKLFSVNLLDESGEIKATGFNEQCDAFYDLLQEGQVYYISTCRVNLAKKQFSNIPNDYELAFERETVIEKAEDQASVPQVRFNFINISELQAVEKDATVDVVGVLKEVGEVSQITAKSTGKFYDKRELTLVDDSQYSVRLTIWGKTATSFAAQPESVVAFKGVKVSDFGGRSLSLLASGTMAVDPDIDEAHRLKGWYDSQGRADNFNTHNSMGMGSATGRQDQVKCVSQIKDEGLGMENTDYFMLKATVVYIRQENFAYPACSSEGCNKKVVDQGDGMWWCENCKVSHPRPLYRYIMSVNINDHTGQLWLSCFDDVGRIIMGMSADELMEIKENDEDRVPAIFEAANCAKLNFRCRAKMDTYGENQRIRYHVMSASPLDYKTEALKLADLIKQFGISS